MNALVIHKTNNALENLLLTLQAVVPEVRIQKITSSLSVAKSYISKNEPKLLFVDPLVISGSVNTFFNTLEEQQARAILLGDGELTEACNHSSVIGFIKRPILTTDVRVTVSCALEYLKFSKQTKSFQLSKKTFPQNRIGIPTMKGFEYIKTNDIIRCEGLQKCTRVVTKDRKDIISSYSLGSFCDLLKNQSFYLIHRSHLINLKKVVRYSRDGFILLSDGSTAPLARRKKAEFLNSWQQI